MSVAEMPPIVGDGDFLSASYTPLEEPSETALFSAERIYMPDELPTIKDLGNDFKILLDGFTHSKYRIGLALEYAQHLKARFEPGTFSADDPEYARSQILPRLYLDMMILTASRDEYHSLLKHLGERRTAASLPSLHRLIGAKIDVQHDIADYDSLYPDKDSQTLFGNLVTAMHHGRRVLYGDNVTSDKAKSQNETQLLAILAEYKVLTTLQEEWPEATFGTIVDDQNGTDIVVPIQKSDRGVALQVKSRLHPDYDLLILGDKEVEVPEIRVPMNTERNDPFQLSFEHGVRIKTFVRNSPRRALAYAA